MPAAPGWMRWLPAFYIAGILVIEPVTPVQWPVSFLLVALPVIAAFAHGPVAVGAFTVFAIVFEGVLAGTPCCAGRPVSYVWDRHYVTAYLCTALVGVLGTLLAAHRVRRERTLATVRFVAEIAQRVLLSPVPHRIGPIQVETLYLSADCPPTRKHASEATCTRPSPPRMDSAWSSATSAERASLPWRRPPPFSEPSARPPTTNRTSQPLSVE
ncbi:hypothetical protein ACFWOJ_12795 [Streptomyces sp. NPDC058439]|uniref:hypothetical protein n=1 Tax=Streptomyces sp. NPDC058439 TaxID=3346500 RepID=UPI003651DDE8